MPSFGDIAVVWTVASICVAGLVSLGLGVGIIRFFVNDMLEQRRYDNNAEFRAQQRERIRTYYEREDNDG